MYIRMICTVWSYRCESVYARTCMHTMQVMYMYVIYM